MYCPQTMHPQAMQKVFSQHYYSSTAHARNRRVTATGNSIKCSVPGLKNHVEIPFPDRKLPVCKRCKKIYKTRELCRVRDKHTEVPWSTTYICVTLDESCFTRNDDGGKKLVEEGPMRFVAHSIPGPPTTYCSKSDTLSAGTKSPICMACKDKNYTRHHCRVKNKHLELPWSTVYVILSAAPAAPGSAGFFDTDSTSTTISKKRSSASTSCSEDEEESNTDEHTSKKSKNNDGEASSVTHKDSDSTDEDGSLETKENVGSRQTIQKIHSSRAFLLTVGKDDCVLAWLNTDPSLPNEPANSNAWSNQPPMDNMYEQPPAYYNNGGSPPQGPSGPPQNWSGYNNNGYFPNNNGNGTHPNVMPPPTTGGGIYGNNGMYGHGQPPNQHMQMPPNGRSTPNDFNSYQQQQHPAHPPHAQMKPNMYPGNNPGQQMPFQQSYSYEDRENQASLMNQGPPGPPPYHHTNNYPNKPFHHHGNDGGNGNGNDGVSQGPPRGSPVQEYLPNGNPNPEHMMHNGNNRGHSNNTMPCLPPAPPVTHPANVNNSIPAPHDNRRDQGYNGNGNSYHGFSRRESYNNAPPPAMNGPGGYGGGIGNSVPFYSSNNGRPL